MMQIFYCFFSDEVGIELALLNHLESIVRKLQTQTMRLCERLTLSVGGGDPGIQCDGDLYLGKFSRRYPNSALPLSSSKAICLAISVSSSTTGYAKIRP